MKRITLFFILFFPLSVAFMSCSSPSRTVQYQQVDTDPYYTSAYPVMDVSSQLERIQQSIIRITSTGRYVNYLIDRDDLTIEELEATDIENVSSEQSVIEETTAGTASVIGKNMLQALLLTCAHTIHFPETMISYREGENIPPETYIESVSVRQNQVNIAITPFGIVYFDVLDQDNEADLALIELSLMDMENENLRPLRITMGESSNLKAGSFIYVLGYPRGFETVTSGIVSLPNRNSRNDFMTDALFNRGISGGVVIASKNNFRSFEWVGVAHAGVASYEYILVPDTDFIDRDQITRPYSGPVLSERKSELNYGMTYAISTQTISRFLDRNRSHIRRVNRLENLITPYEDY
ncbi:MAG: serine protease [Balneolaceae bacterium]